MANLRDGKMDQDDDLNDQDLEPSEPAKGKESAAKESSGKKGSSKKGVMDSLVGKKRDRSNSGSSLDSSQPKQELE